MCCFQPDGSFSLINNLVCVLICDILRFFVYACVKLAAVYLCVLANKLPTLFVRRVVCACVLLAIAVYIGRFFCRKVYRCMK